MLTLIIFFIVLSSGQNLERFVIMLTAFHRDYATDGFNLEIKDYQFGLVYFLLWLENTLLFSGVVFIIWFLSEKIKESNA